jgi:hypothetical protein
VGRRGVICNFLVPMNFYLPFPAQRNGGGGGHPIYIPRAEHKWRMLLGQSASMFLQQGCQLLELSLELSITSGSPRAGHCWRMPLGKPLVLPQFIIIKEALAEPSLDSSISYISAHIPFCRIHRKHEVNKQTRVLLPSPPSPSATVYSSIIFSIYSLPQMRKGERGKQQESFWLL